MQYPSLRAASNRATAPRTLGGVARRQLTRYVAGPMRRLDTRIPGPILIAPIVHGDDRGFFHESWRRDVQEQLGITDEFVQDNHSRSRRGVVRGMHLQIGEGIGKLVRCARGAILDVVVDVRRGSPTYSEWEAFELNDDNLRQLYVPVGFAHGFCTLSDVADVLYKQTGYYDPQLERGIAYDDPAIGIEWPSDFELFVSERDATAPTLREVADQLPFVYEPSRAASRGRDEDQSADDR